MRIADDFFDRKMDGGILWQKIKRKKKLLGLILQKNI